MKNSRASGWLVGGVAVVAVVCCAFPVIVAGAFGAAVGIGLGSWLLVGIGVAMVALGVWRRHRHLACERSDRDAATRVQQS